jgi:hypothetical protein
MDKSFTGSVLALLVVGGVGYYFLRGYVQNYIQQAAIQSHDPLAISTAFGGPSEVPLLIADPFGNFYEDKVG